MPLYTWETVKKEQLNPKIWRRVVNGEKLTIAQLSVAKDGSVPVHHHENEQLSYVLEGAFKFEVDGKEVIVRKGEILQIPANVPHGVVALEDTFGIEIFTPVRLDWMTGQDDYLRKEK